MQAMPPSSKCWMVPPAVTGSTVPLPSNSHSDILTPSTSEWDLIWKAVEDIISFEEVVGCKVNA